MILLLIGSLNTHLKVFQRIRHSVEVENGKSKQVFVIPQEKEATSRRAIATLQEHCFPAQMDEQIVGKTCLCPFMSLMVHNQVHAL